MMYRDSDSVIPREEDTCGAALFVVVDRRRYRQLCIVCEYGHEGSTRVLTRRQRQVCIRDRGLLGLCGLQLTLRLDSMGSEQD